MQIRVAIPVMANVLSLMVAKKRFVGKDVRAMELYSDISSVYSPSCLHIWLKAIVNLGAMFQSC